MQLGAIFPQTEIGADPGGVRDFAQAAEAMGYEHLLVFDHVLGADASQHANWDRPYRHTDMFHEPFVLFGYLAALTETIQMTTGILILGQRQTVLVAKQAAEVDVLTGGRLRLGIGIGWNHVEYECLGYDYRTRGRRIEEQVALLRQLWTEQLVEFQGTWDSVRHAGINPLPERQIPIWMGGRADAVLDRIGRIGDGWLAAARSREEFKAMVETIHRSAIAAGRDPADISLGSGVSARGMTPAEQAARAVQWDAVGVTHCSILTMDSGFTSLGEHIDAIRAFREAYAAATR